MYVYIYIKYYLSRFVLSFYWSGLNMITRNTYSFPFLPLLSFLFLLSLAFLLSCSPELRKKEYKELIDRSPEFEKNFTGFMLFDPEERKDLYSYNSDKYFTPASNTKVFTLYTALQVLGDSVPGIRYTIRGDSLIFTGIGDPSFLNPVLPQSKVYDYLKASNKNLFYVRSLDSLKALGPGWAWDDYNDDYSAEKAHFPIYGNIARFYVNSSRKEISVIPTFFSDSVVQKEQDQLSASLVQRNVNNNTFTFNAHGEGWKKEKEVPFKWSPKLAVALLSDTLHKDVQLLNHYPRHLDKTLYSIPADSLYKRMMQSSDNFIAEQILLIISSQLNGRFSPDTVIQCLSEMYLHELPDVPVWVDGSGLSRYNLFTPRSIVYIWDKMLQEIPQERLFSLLAVGGKSGSIENQFKADEPYVFAKTGTLSNNHCLSGFIKAKSGKILIFSFMLNNHVDNLDKLKQEIEKVLWEVHVRN